MRFSDETWPVKKLLLIVLLVGGSWYGLHEPAAHWRGIPAVQDPQQAAGPLPTPFQHGDYMIIPLATYHISAVVLSRSRYRYDHDAVLAPVDLALGWGPMSVASVINDLSISQSGRWYEYRWANEPPLEPAEIARHSANTHCLPADAAVRDALLAVKRHDRVTLDGYLVEVHGPKGYRWRSSLTREDTGGGSCEVMWITHVEHARL